MNSPAASAPKPVVTHDPDHHRFTSLVDGMPSRLDYRFDGEVMVLVHTEVDPGLQGRGVGAALVTAALAHAEADGLKVRPACSYAASHMQRHPETRHLLA